MLSFISLSFLIVTFTIIGYYFYYYYFTIISAEQDESCLINDREGSKYLGTKTPYRLVANKEDSVIEYKGCHPLKIVGVIRHGTRTPGHKAEKKIRLKLGALKDHIEDGNLPGLNSVLGNFCEHYFHSQIKKWAFTLEKEGEKVLTKEGEDEMIKLAKRIKSRFPTLLNQEYSNSSYYFRFTDSQRTRESAKFFTIGLFGDKANQVWFPEPEKNDYILRFYKLCDKWIKEVDENSESSEELEKFLLTDEVKDMLKRVTERMGLNYTLNYEVDLKSMYTTCGFETAWNRKTKSSWCSFLSERDFKILEFAEDLKYYWNDGYGFEINHNQACPLIKNVFTQFLTKDGPQSVFYFTHSGTMLKTLSHLGLYKDEYALTHTVQVPQRDSRKWKVSKIDTFASNVIFVLYCCGGDLKVLLLHQERIIKFPGCNESDMCSLKKLKELFKKSLDCDFKNICASS